MLGGGERGISTQIWPLPNLKFFKVMISDHSQASSVHWATLPIYILYMRDIALQINDIDSCVDWWKLCG